MKKWKIFLISLILILSIISVLTIYSAGGILGSDYANLYLKQLIWYMIGFMIVFLLYQMKNDFILKHIWIFYLLGNLSLLLLLFFGKDINHAKCWFEIPYLGTIQPSEFVKIILILTLSIFSDNYLKKHKNMTLKEEFWFIIQVFGITLLPSVLTFLQPDTGAVLIYFIITISILFISGIRYRWFVIAFLFIAILLGTILYFYFFQKK